MMNLPEFLQPQISISLPSNHSSAAVTAGNAAGGAGGGSRTLSFNIQPQEQTFWCWAAVSASISEYYDSGTYWTQCRVADTALGRHDCCLDGASDQSKCNKEWYLDGALRITGNLRQNIVTGPLSFAAIQSEIAADAPVGCRVGWHVGGGHFMAIVGWVVADSGTEYIEISDPIYLNSQIDYSAFANSYVAGGDWTHSYLTVGATMGGATPVSAQTLDPTSIGA